MILDGFVGCFFRNIAQGANRQKGMLMERWIFAKDRDINGNVYFNASHSSLL